MATSPSRGDISLDLNEALKRLNSICTSNVVQKIYNALGLDSALYLVGGAVRDSVLGATNVDIDLASILRPEEICDRLSKRGIHWVPTGIEHGTVLAVVDGVHGEITTFRRPGPRLRPNSDDNYSSSIEDDLSGRDFTINAVAYSVTDNKIVDPFSGIEDMKRDVVRCVGDPTARFREDPLRILRMIRFGNAAGRSIDEVTWQRAGSTVNQLKEISYERIRDELLKILLSDYPSNGLRAMRDLGALDIVLPEIIPSYDFEQNEYHRFDVFEHTLAVLDNTPPDLYLRLTALFHDLGKPHTLSVDKEGKRHFYKHELVSTDLTKDALRRLRLPNSTVKDVAKLVRYHMRPLNCGPAGIRRLVRDLGPLLDLWLMFKEADSLGAKVAPSEFNLAKDEFMKLLVVEQKRGQDFLKLSLTGEDILALGVAEGPSVGRVLKSLKEMVILDPSLNTKEKLLEIAREKLL